MGHIKSQYKIGLFSNPDPGILAFMQNDLFFQGNSCNLPVFAWGMPRMVAEFVSKMSLKGHPYIFAVATCVAIPGNTLRDLQQLLRQRRYDLQAGFVVKAGRSSLMNLNSLDKIIIIAIRG